MTDPIADMFARISNALAAKHTRVDVPSSKLKLEIARILKNEGYIHGFKLIDNAPAPRLRIYLKYGPRGERVITGVERVSRPGRRVYVPRDGIERVMGGIGINILSTSRGVMTGSEAGRVGVGGEVLCNIW